MNNHNELAKARKRRGRPEQPLKFEIEFIDDGKSRERWDNIFELLETGDLQQGVGRAATEEELETSQLNLF